MPVLYWLVVSTHLKNISQIGSFPQVGVKIKNNWNHHLVYFWTYVSLLLFPSQGGNPFFTGYFFSEKCSAIKHPHQIGDQQHKTFLQKRFLMAFHRDLQMSSQAFIHIHLHGSLHIWWLLRWQLFHRSGQPFWGGEWAIFFGFLAQKMGFYMDLYRFSILAMGIYRVSFIGILSPPQK